MPLSPEREQEVRDEAFYRGHVRQSIKRQPTAWDRFNSFFDSRVGFWILTTLLAGVVATGFTWLQQYNDREKLRAQAEAEAARRDIDMLLKVVDPDVANKVQSLIRAKLDDVLNALSRRRMKQE